MTIDSRTYKDYFYKGLDYLFTKGWVYILLVICLFTFYKLSPQLGLPGMLAFGMVPLGVILVILLLRNTLESFYVLFGMQFLLVMGGMFVDMKLGVFTLILTLFIASLFIIHNIYKPIDYSNSRNGMLWLYLFWGIYCLAELVNPNNVMEAYNISITHYLVYPVLCAILVPLAVRNTNQIHWLLLIWSVFILIAAFKGYWQKTHGFNARENYFLYVLGGAKTHIIWSGIRYFSCFSDAANYGVHMAMAIAAFGISIFYTKNGLLKLYYLVVVVAGVYGMGISGTRAAIAIPVGGLALFTLLSGNRRTFASATVILLLLFSFFRFTTIGEGNEYIRKMRSAFNPTEDASYQVRVVNRERMKVLMASKPIGYGIGLSKSERFRPRERMPYPPDSWLVSVWVETGIVGLSLYLLVHGALFAWCSWILMFKIRHKQLRGLLTAWLCMNAGYFIAAYANDVMQYPNSLVIYTGFALCFAGPHIDRLMFEKEEKARGLLQQKS